MHDGLFKGVMRVSRGKHRALDPEREQQVISELVDMYIEADGIMPSQRAIKKNPYISEEEVSILRRNGAYSEARIRHLAEAKTGQKYKTSFERHKDNSIKSSHERAKTGLKVVEVEVKEVGAMNQNDKDERIKVVCEALRQFGTKNLRWPSDKEIHEMVGRDGWASSAELYRLLGTKGEWAQQVFPDGIPEGFIEDARKLKGEMRPSKSTSKPVDEPVENQAGELFQRKEAKIEVDTGEMKISIPVTLTIPSGLTISGRVQLTLD